MTQPTDIRRVPGRRPRLLDAFCCQGWITAQSPALEGSAAA